MSLIASLSLLCILLFLPHTNPSGPCAPTTYPYVVTLRMSSTLASFCGGSLLHPRWVLTASHCTYDITHPTQVVVGGLNASTRKVGVRQIFMHDLYDPKTVQNDVALIQLDQDLQPYNKGAYAKMPASNGSACKMATIVGRVQNRLAIGEAANNTKYPLYCINALIMEREHCEQAFKNLVTVGNLCMSFGGKGEQPCPGDSGGPVVCDGRVVGVISFGSKCTIHFLPSVVTNVAAVLDFVERVLKEHNETIKGGEIVRHSKAWTLQLDLRLVVVGVVVLFKNHIV